MSKFESFVYGRDKVPTWFNDYCSTGRARINYDEDGKEVSIVVFNLNGAVYAHPGDSVVLTKSGLGVLQKEKAVKYGVQRNDKKESTNEEGIQQKVDE